MKWQQLALFILSGLALSLGQATNNILNVYTWAGEIPYRIIEQFEKETGIKVNYSSFDSNEVMYAKLRTNSKGYDIIEPSGYFIARMQQLGMLEKLDFAQLPNYKHLDPFFSNPPYDPEHYSIPYIWGITGIFYNKEYFNEKDALQWSDFLNKNLTNQIMFLSEARTAFSTALRMLGYSINDKNPEHIKAAFYKLKELLPNVRLFNSDAVISILIDEDATIGMAWNGDVQNAMKENSKLQFVFPKDGFEIWVDNFVLLKNAPHRKNAYRFLNFLMRPDIASEVSLTIGYSSTNLSARHLMPPEVRNNPVLYPAATILRRGEFQLALSDQVSELIETYWELLKMGG